MGRHSAPSTTGKTLAKFGAAALAATGPLALIPGTAEAAPSTDSILAAIASCESGNRNVPTGIVDRNGRRLSTAGGYWQIVNGTWRAHGGTQFAPTALQASYAEQLIVARRILTEGQGIGAWSESKGCWSRRIGKIQPVAPVEQKPTPKPQVKPQPKAKPKAKPKTEVKSAPKTIKKQQQTAPTKSMTAKRAAASYVIKRGDTLSRIARRNGTTVSRLASLNRGTVRNVDLIFAGNHLRLR